MNRVLPLLFGALAIASPTWLRAQSPVPFNCEDSGENCTAPIPEGSVSSTITVPEAGCVQAGRVEVGLELDHPWVGDLTVTLSHGSRSVVLLARPGLTQTEFGCSSNGVDATFADDAATAASSQCSPVYPAISGLVRPDELLSSLSTDAGGGDWTLTVVDSYLDTALGTPQGQLLGWSLLLECAAPTPTPTETPSPTQTPPPAAVVAIDPIVDVKDPIRVTGSLPAGQYEVCVVPNGTYTVGAIYEGTRVSCFLLNHDGGTFGPFEIWREAAIGQYDLLVLQASDGRIVAGQDLGAGPAFIVREVLSTPGIGLIVLGLMLAATRRRRRKP